MLSPWHSFAAGWQPPEPTQAWLQEEGKVRHMRLSAAAGDLMPVPSTGRLKQQPQGLVGDSGRMQRRCDATGRASWAKAGLCGEAAADVGFETARAVLLASPSSHLALA